MLSREDRRAIEELFDRLADIERRSPERDAEAERLIAAEIARLPAAPYYLAQTVVVQQNALEAAERRIKELEGAAAERARDVAPARRNPWDRSGDTSPAGVGRGAGGGGFLAGAMQTAVGVAGGVLLGSAIGSLLGAGGAHAAESRNDASGDSAGDSQSDADNDVGADGSDMDSDFGGGFDAGGDF